MEDVSGNTSLSVLDSNGSLAVARVTEDPFKMGSVTFAPGRVTFQADHVEFAGSLISSRFSELDPDLSRWVIYLTCNNPTGAASVTGVLSDTIPLNSDMDNPIIVPVGEGVDQNIALGQ